MNISLRPYQQDFIDAVRNEFQQKHKRVVGVAPCGAGKTIMTGWMIREALKRGNRSIFFVHRKELIDQTAKTFLQLDIPFGVISAGFDMNLNLPVQIASVQTLARRLDQIPAPDFLICDECHHILANTYQKVLAAFPKAFLLGVTATPLRMGNVTLSDSFDSMVQSLSVNQLIELGNLTKFKYIAPSIPPELDKQLKHARSNFGEFSNADLEKIMNNKHIIGNIVDSYRQYAAGKSAICYCVNVNHSESVADAFNAAGISAAHCDGDTPAALRAAIVNDFRCGNIKVLCNAELFGEGFDVPGCQAVILARPTQSLTLFIQQAMRPLRPDPDDPNKVAVIIDLVQNRVRHGLPNDDRDWSLVPKLPKKVQCPNCQKEIVQRSDQNLDLCRILQDNYKRRHPRDKIIVDVDINRFVRDGEDFNHKFCPVCGYIFPKGEAVNGSRNPKYSTGELDELSLSFDTSSADTAPIIKKKPTSPEDFLIIAREKGYKIYWVACQSLKFAKSEQDCKHIAKVCGYKPGWGFHAWNELQEEIISSQTLQNARFLC